MKNASLNILSGTRILNQILGDKTVFILNLSADEIHDCIEPILTTLIEQKGITTEELPKIAQALKLTTSKGPSELEAGVAVLHQKIDTLSSPIQVLVRLSEPLVLGKSGDIPTSFIWVLLSNAQTHPLMRSVAEFVHLMHDPTFHEKAYLARTPKELVEIYQEGLDNEIHFSRISPAFATDGKLFSGIIADIRNRLPHWISDFTCGFSIKVLASILFMFFACAAPTIAYGALAHALTDGQIGVIETILATAGVGILWSLFAGQPLTIVGLTGPNVIFIGILYSLCQTLSVEFLPVTFWVGMWTMVFLLTLASFNASSLIRFFTRFTDEIFASLISLIFISQALSKSLALFDRPDIANDTALLSLFLSLGTFVIAINLARFRRTPYLRASVREFLSDFGPSIALISMTALAYYFEGISFETLAVPNSFQTSIPRPWIISPFTIPTWAIIGSAIPACLLSILLWVNHNITARLVNSSEHKLKKGASYHYDIALLGILTGILSIFGLPWVVGSVLLSLNHVRSLTISEHGETIGTVESRISNMGVHLILCISLSSLYLLRYMPTSVLYGIFLYMGIGSLRGNQFIERLRLWFVDPELFHPTHHLRAVPLRIIHLFTGVQFLCLVILWIIKGSAIGIVFPLFVALLVPVRMFLGKVFEPEYVALLDMEETPEDEKFREFGS